MPTPYEALADKARCLCVGSAYWCSHEGRCEEPVEGCGGSDNYCQECFLNAVAEESAQDR